MQVYASVFALATVTCKRSVSRVASTHLEIVLLTSFCVNAFRNLWPLMTYTSAPADAFEGYFVWIKITLFGFSGIVIPLTMPRKYIPLDPRVRHRSAYVR
jgi:hypothetical protein